MRVKILPSILKLFFFVVPLILPTLLAPLASGQSLECTFTFEPAELMVPADGVMDATVAITKSEASANPLPCPSFGFQGSDDWIQPAAVEELSTAVTNGQRVVTLRLTYSVEANPSDQPRSGSLVAVASPEAGSANEVVRGTLPITQATSSGGGSQTASLAVVDAAGFGPVLAADMLASAFTSAIPDVTEFASATPLPTMLAGFEIIVTDSTGVDRPAGIVGVFPGQSNFVIPAATAPGTATFTVRRDGAVVALTTVEIELVAPGIFALSPSRVPAGFALIVAADGTQTTQPLFQLGDQGIFEPLPIDLSDDTQQVFLLLFATGVRGRPDLSDVSAEVAGVPVAMLFAGPQGEFEALDQLNLGPLPREQLSGRGKVDLKLSVGEPIANLVELSFTGPLLITVPVLSELEPTSIIAGQQTIVTLTGLNLSEVTSVEVSPADGVSIGAIASAAVSPDGVVEQALPESITVEIDVAADATPGVRALSAVNANGSSNEVALTITAPEVESLTISNLELSVEVQGLLGLVVDAGFDFSSREPDLIFSGMLETSARIEAVLRATSGTNRCIFLLAGARLSFPEQTSGRFELGVLPTFQQGLAESGPGVAEITLIAPDGTRSNTLQADVNATPLCAADSEPQAFVFP